MAETAKGGLDFLKQKVGPLPLGIWLAAGAGLVLYFQRKQSPASSASQAPNQQTDPAGNIGSIDPATGYVYGTPEDTAALAADNSGSTGTSSAGQSATAGAQAYADNNAWGIAAVNYLVGLGIDATTANQAVQLYLSSQPLSTAQQGDVNLAINALGPPPTLPGPTNSSPPPVTTPPGGGGTGGKKKTAPVPTGFTVVKVTASSVALKWNRSSGATGYHLVVHNNPDKAKDVQSADVPSSVTTHSFAGLKASSHYAADCYAEPEAGAKGTGQHAVVTFTTPKK